MRLYFLNAQNDDAGGVHIKFSSPPRYNIGYCFSGWTDFPTTLPSATEKIWRITLEKRAGVRVIKIHCNGVEVLNFLLSDQTCPDYYNYYADSTYWYNYYDLAWDSYYRRDVTKIRLYSPRTDPSYYRPHTMNTGILN